MTCLHTGCTKRATNPHGECYACAARIAKSVGEFQTSKYRNAYVQFPAEVTLSDELAAAGVM